MTHFYTTRVTTILDRSEVNSISLINQHEMFEINDKEIIFTERNRNVLLAGLRYISDIHFSNFRISYETSENTYR